MSEGQWPRVHRVVVLGVMLGAGVGCGAGSGLPVREAPAMPEPEPEPAPVQQGAGREEAHAAPDTTQLSVLLPRAHNVAPLSGGAPVVTVTREEVLLDGQRVADTRALAAAPRVQRVEALVGALRARKAGGRAGALESVQIRADWAVTFGVIVPLMFSCAQAGYPHFEYAVVDEAGAEARVDVTHAPPPDPTALDREEIRVMVAVERDRYVISSTAGDRLEIPAREGALDGEALERALAARRALEPARREVVLTGGGDVAYGEIVAALDRLAGHGFDQVLVASVAEPGARPSLSREDIREVIRANIDDVRHCYENDMDESGRVYDGRVAVKFIIAPDGAVSRAAVANDTTGSIAVGKCIVDAVKTWRFPEPEGGGIVVVTYPFVLQTVLPEEGGGAGAGGGEAPST